MRNISLLLPALAAGTLTVPAAANEPTVNELIAQGKFCTATAAAVFRACSNETLGDYWIGLGSCINESEGPDRTECFAELKDGREEADEECVAQREARTDLCRMVGEERYDPEFEPRDFDRDFRNLTIRLPTISCATTPSAPSSATDKRPTSSTVSSTWPRPTPVSITRSMAFSIS